MERLELTILKNLIFDENYPKKVLPFIQPEYFDNSSEKIIYEEITKYMVKYGKNITLEALSIECDNRRDLNESEYTNLKNELKSINAPSKVDSQWLLDITEKWCKDKAIYNAIVESLEIVNGKSKDKTRDAIPTVLSEALSLSFDSNVGHDYIDNYSERYDFYHKKEERVPFDIDYLNTITKGGLPKKTLNVILAGTGVGKSLFMCHVASSSLLQGKNVLYITLEMAEEKIAERIDANLLDIPIQDLFTLSKDKYESKIIKLAQKTNGKLIIKEYPTGAAHTGHFKALLNELALKKSFSPDIIFVDYLNICASSRFKGNGSINSYSYIKAIAEELRGLAVQYNVPILTATQTNRSGFGSSDIELTDTSESFGLPATADMMIALISTDELEEVNQIMVKQLKNRYNDPTINKKRVIGVDRSKMRLLNLEDSAQDNLYDTGYDEEDNTFSSSSKTSNKFSKLKFN